jgi:UDP-glucuronate decarboxylase
MLEDDGRVISNFVSQCLRGKPITIFGDGSQTRSFCYVDDLIEGLLRLMASSETTPVNLGCPDELSMLDLAAKIRAITGSRSEIIHLPKPADDPVRRCPDITQARERLGWQPGVALDDGLRRTITEFRKRSRIASR